MDTFADEQLRYRIALASIKGMNRLLAESLLQQVGDVSAFFTLTPHELSDLVGCNSSLFSQEERGRALRVASDEVTFIRNKGIHHSFSPIATIRNACLSVTMRPSCSTTRAIVPPCKYLM